MCKAKCRAAQAMRRIVEQVSVRELCILQASGKGLVRNQV
jgi:hypothetical protein